MPIEKSGFAWDETFAAHSSGSLAAYQYFAVYSTGVATNGLGYVALCITSTNGANRAIGVLQNDPAAGQAADVRLLGITKWATSATVSAGALVTCGTDGTALSATTTAHVVLGKALSASVSTSGELIDVLLFPMGNWFA
jgi:hypothetical protein